MAGGFGVPGFKDGEQTVEKTSNDELNELPDLDDGGEPIDELPETDDNGDEIDELPETDEDDGEYDFPEDSMLAVLNKKNSKDVEKSDDDTADVKEEAQVVKNKREGCERENKVEEELREKYPESEGYQIVKEAYLRDKDGNFVIDPETGKRRRIDFVVVKDGKVVDSVEVTSMKASKEVQLAKEQRIRDEGGNYVYDNNGELAEFPENVTTRIERRP